LYFEVVTIDQERKSREHCPPIKQDIDRYKEEKEQRKKDNQGAAVGIVKVQQPAQGAFPNFDDGIHNGNLWLDLN
jgi:hypothetical protein